MMAPPSQQFQLEASINWKVRNFNDRHPNGDDYYDLHGMTTMGMISYVQDIVQQMRRTGGTKAWLEVGRGNHSANEFPAMKTHLMNNCHLFPGFSFVPIIGNDDSIMMCPPTFFGTTAQFFYPTEMMFSMPQHYAPMPLALPMQPSGFGYFPQPQPCGSYSEENKENAGPSNFKTRLCKLHNSGKSIVCPHGANCSDGLLYKFCQADTLEFKVLKGHHQEAIQKLHAQKMMAPPSQQFQLEASINWKVRQFNVGHPNGKVGHPNDLHGMTTMGMVSYIQDIVKQMRRTGGTKEWLEVGRGTHSANGFPAMKTHLMNNCHLFPGCSFVPIIESIKVMCPPTTFGVATQGFFLTEMMFSMPPPFHPTMAMAVPMQQYGYEYYPQLLPCGPCNKDNKENEVPSNYKTRLCKLHNSGKSIVCPHGAACRFAHGVEELRSNGSIPDQQVANKSYKTILCRNYAPGGSGDCPYRLACQYIHPSDGLLYKFCRADTPEFKVLKRQHQEEIQQLHTQRMMAPLTQQFQLEAAINLKVRQFNVEHPNGKDYHDLHGMTTMGMVSYIQDIVKQMRMVGAKKAWLEVGRGTHSANGFPAMKTHLMNNCHLFPGCSFVSIIGNNGILELSVV
ncbi:hypothetical protein L3Y34_019496 [Caenorhabditis briggsae]|uniref:C3H1-type domain-containing protein n=1 Tax=Caenorhabditis briggsae TaxID=6238 RepID=A0AAE9DN28_CAEBR|nr:hypothetical protein L3Y34_019496 [Caenorhabditis briggsae]